MSVLATIEWGKLAQLVYAAPLAGFAVAVTFAIAIFGAGRAEDARRAGSDAATAGFGVLTVVALAAFLGAVVFGVTIIAS